LKEKYIIRYDPRDIREIYAWIDIQKKYVAIPLKGTYHKPLQINPNDINDLPLSKKELEEYKKHNSKKYPSQKFQLSEALDNRQKILEESRLNSKSKKYQRRRREILHTHKERATATVIRENRNLPVQENRQIEDDNRGLQNKATDLRSYPIKLLFEEDT
jgi:hypothetical protein